MLYRQRFNTFIRIYEDIGYVTNRTDFTDRVIDRNGTIFLRSLSRKTKDLTQIVAEISEYFIDIDKSVLQTDIVEFFDILEQDGFIISGETDDEIEKKDKHFSYSSLQPKTINNNFTPLILRSENNTQEYFSEYFKNKPHLVHFQIEISNCCNERCIHCYIPHKDKIRDIAPDLFYDTLEQCSKMGVLNITITGGEPFMHPQICEFLNKLKEYDFAVGILSNLTLLNDEILGLLKKIRLSGVQVSLYSMDPEIHDSITQMPGSFVKTRDAILKLMDNDIPVQISCPTMKQNKACYADVLNWAHDHKCRSVTDCIMMARNDHTNDNLDNRLSLDEVCAVLNDIINNDNDYQNDVSTADFDERDQRDRSDDIVCGICISSICMDPFGNIYPCSGWQGYIAGNISEQLLEEIWNNSPKIKYLRNLRIRDFPKCINCENIKFCEICMVRNANEDPNGDPLKINEHFCKVAALNRKIVLEWKENKC